MIQEIINIISFIITSTPYVDSVVAIDIASFLLIMYVAFLRDWIAAKKIFDNEVVPTHGTFLLVTFWKKGKRNGNLPAVDISEVWNGTKQAVGKLIAEGGNALNKK